MVIFTKAPAALKLLGNVILYHDVAFTVSFIVKFISTLLPAFPVLSVRFAVTLPTVSELVRPTPMPAANAKTSTISSTEIIFLTILDSLLIICIFTLNCVLHVYAQRLIMYHVNKK